MIALEELDEVKAANDKNDVYVGRDNRWLEFYTELEKHDLASSLVARHHLGLSSSIEFHL